MADRIKVGLATHAGGAHLDAYFTALAATEEVEAVALADPSGGAVESAKRTLGDRLQSVHRELPAMLEQFRPALVLLSMEAAQSPPAIRLALEHDCHVFAEKPACVRAEDFEVLVRLADHKGLHLMLALANRLNPEIQAARRLIESNELGKIYAVEMHLIADQTRLTRPAYHQTWFAQKARAGGGHLSWLGIHWLDLAVFLTGAKVNQVAGFVGNVGGQPIDVEDSSAVALRYDNGALGTLSSGYYLDRGYHSHIKIWGATGWLHLEPMEEMPLRWYVTQGDNAGKMRTFDGPKEPRGYTPFVRAAVRACAKLQQPPISNADSLHAVQTVYAIYDAAASGKAARVG